MAILPPQADLPRNRKGLPGGEGQAEGQEGRGLRKAKGLWTVFGIYRPLSAGPQTARELSSHSRGVTFPGPSASPSPSLGPLRTLR